MYSILDISGINPGTRTCMIVLDKLHSIEALFAACEQNLNVFSLFRIILLFCFRFNAYDNILIFQTCSSPWLLQEQAEAGY